MEHSKLVGFACGMALVAAGPIAAARAAEGFYFGVQLGAVLLEDTDTGVDPSCCFTSIDEIEFDYGIVAGGVVGYGFSDVDVLRVEAEVSYRENDIDGSAGDIGDISALAGMVNVYFDFLPGKSWRPYIGGGIGGAYVDFDNTAFLFSDTDIVFAYQAMAGVEYKITPRLSLGAEYRYFAMDDPEFDGIFPFSTPVTVESEYQSHNFLARLRYYFK